MPASDSYVIYLAHPPQRGLPLAFFTREDARRAGYHQVNEVGLQMPTDNLTDLNQLRDAILRVQTISEASRQNYKTHLRNLIFGCVGRGNIFKIPTFKLETNLDAPTKEALQSEIIQEFAQAGIRTTSSVDGYWRLELPDPMAGAMAC